MIKIMDFQILKIYPSLIAISSPTTFSCKRFGMMSFHYDYLMKLTSLNKSDWNIGKQQLLPLALI